MKIEIDFNKKEIALLEPTSLKDLTSRLGELGISDFKIVSKHTEHTKQLIEKEPIDYSKLNSLPYPGQTPNSFPPYRSEDTNLPPNSGGTIGNNYYKTEGIATSFGQRSEDC